MWKLNISATLPDIVKLTAELKGISVQEAAAALDKNARAFYRFGA